MTRILESALLCNKGGHLHFSRLNGSNFLAEQRDTYLWRLYEYWLGCSEAIPGDEVRLLLPHFRKFRPDDALSGNEIRFVTSVDMTVALSDIEPQDAAIFGCSSSIDERTVGWCWACANSREPLYYFVKLHDHGIVQECYRLLLPSVDDSNKVVRIDIAHRFEGLHLQVVPEEALP